MLVTAKTKQRSVTDGEPSLPQSPLLRTQCSSSSVFVSVTSIKPLCFAINLNTYDHKPVKLDPTLVDTATGQPIKPIAIPLSTSGRLKCEQVGFTLIEIMVVIVILSIFAGMMSLSVGSSESRKNRAFYEHLTDSLSYVRLLSAERMQPMGLKLQADKQGQVTPVIVSLSNAYVAYQNTATDATDGRAKNAMELSAMSSEAAQTTPSWDRESEVVLPQMPEGVSLNIQSLDTANSTSARGQTLQPWFSEQSVPQILWFGTGQATPVTIEVRHDARLVGEVITIMPDGSVMLGQERL